MHNDRLNLFVNNQAPRAHASHVIACFLAMLMTASIARAEVIAEGDFTPDYDNADPMNASAMPLFGNDPDGVFSPIQMDVPVIIGESGIGKLTIDTPSFTFPLVSLGDPDPSIIGKESTALGEALVTGFGSEWKILGKLIVAEEGTGFLNLTGGARVTAEDDAAAPLSIDPEIVIGDLEGSEGFVTIDGFGSRLDSVVLTIANEGNADVVVSGRGSILTRGEAFIGVEEDTVAKVTFTGLGTRWLVIENADIIGGSLDGNLMVGSEISGGVGHSTLVINEDALVQVDGVMTINPHGLLELGGGTLRTIETLGISNSGFVTNLGVIRGDGWIEGGLVNETGGELRNASAGFGLREQMLVTGLVENDGLIDSIGGEMEFLSEVTNDNDIVARDALMRFRDGLINNGQLVLGGDTTVYGDITSGGDIHTLSGSEAAIVGDLTFSSSSVVGLAAGTDQGTLDIIGIADLGGALLELDYSAGISAQAGDSYQVLAATEGLGGTFGNTSVVADGLLWDILYSSNTVTVMATDITLSPSGADFNGDGLVDQQDLVIWEGNFSTLVGAANGDGDADADADVDGNDFLHWQRQFGGPPPAVAAVAAVPEPTAGLLLVMGGLLLLTTLVRPIRLQPVRVRR